MQQVVANFSLKTFCCLFATTGRRRAAAFQLRVHKLANLVEAFANGAKNRQKAKDGQPIMGSSMQGGHPPPSIACSWHPSGQCPSCLRASDQRKGARIHGESRQPGRVAARTRERAGAGRPARTKAIIPLRPWRPLRLCVQAPADKALIGGRCHPAFTNGKHYRMRGIGSRRINWGGEKGARRSRKSSSSKPGELRKKVAMGNSIQMRSA